MAKIKGYEAKAIKTFMGEDYQGFTANLYHENKKVGTVADYGYGGPISIDVSKDGLEEMQRLGEEYLKEKGSEFDSIDIFASDIVQLKELEGDFKKAIKQGYGSVVMLSDNFEDENGNTKGAKMTKSLRVPKNYKGDVNEENYDNVEVYSSLEDFIIK